MRRSAGICGCMLLSCCVFSVSARGNITIKRDPPIVEHKTFDPVKPPKEMPHLNPGEAAVTESIYNCAVSTSYHATERHPQEGRCDCVVKIDAVEVRLQLH